MAVTKTTYTQSGNTTQYNVPFEVIAAADIDVYINGVLQLEQNTASTAAADHPQVVSGEITQGTALTNYTVAANNATITFNAAPAASAFIIVERTTDSTGLSTFVNGSTIRAKDLNDSFERVLFIAEEGTNVAGEALVASDGEDDAFDAKNDKIINLANGTDDDDAVNRAQLGKVITDDLVAGNGVTLSDASGGSNSGKQTTISVPDGTASVKGLVKINSTDPITTTYNSAGDVTLSIADNSIDFDKIKNVDIIEYSEQNAGSVTPADTNLFTASAAARRFDTIVQTNTPSGSNWQVGKTWLQNDADKTLSVWDGNSWEGISSGGTFTSQSRVIYVDAVNGNDDNDGHRISRPKATIKDAIADINADSTYGDGAVVIVSPGVYQEAAPIQIQRRDVSIIGQSLRSCIVHPTQATETNTLFEVNSGTYLSNLTFTGMKASGTRGASGSLWEDSTYGLPPTQGWNVAFFAGATIVKSPYIQNCTNFSDSEIDNTNLNFWAGTEDKGRAGDEDSAPTGGGILIDGSVPSATSPLRSIVCDSYTHVGLDGPGILVTNNGYCQATSSYAFFNHFHIACINGGQANLAASTSDFGRYSLIADGKSPNPVLTSTVDGAANSGATSFNIDAASGSTDLYNESGTDNDNAWFGSATRPAPNMLVEVNNVIYPILSVTANGSGWTINISRPDSNNRSNNLGLNGAISDAATVNFYLRSMIASSGHTMEYVGSGTDYSALPENGGVPNEVRQITELNNGKIWTAITDHNGKFKIGGNQTDDPFFEVDQQLGFVTIPEGSIAFNLLSDETPELAANLDANSNRITDLADPTAAQDAATKNYVDTEISGLVDSAPATLDTLNELAAALGDDANFSTTVTNSIAAKLPLAGGTMTGNLDLNDNVKARFGTGDDLEIYHDGSNSFISDTGTGDLVISGTHLRLRSAAAETYLLATADGSVELYYDNSKKLETKSDGIDVTGEVQCDSLDVDGAADITGEVNLHNNLSLQDNDKINLGGGNDLQIYHDGSNSYIQDIGDGSLHVRGTNLNLQDSGGYNFITCNDTGTGGTVYLYHQANEKLATTSSGIDVTGTVACDGLTCEGDATISASTGVLVLKDSNSTGDATNCFIRGRDSADTQVWYMGQTSTGAQNLEIVNTRNADLRFGTNNTFRARFNSSGHFYPDSNNSYDLGTSTNKWKDGWFDGVVDCDGAVINGKVRSVENTATASSFDLNNGNFWTFGAIAVPNPTNQSAGMSGLLRVTAAPTSFASNWKFPGGSYTAPASFPAVAPFFVQASGTILVGNWTEGIT